MTVTVVELGTFVEACTWRLPLDWPAGITRLEGTGKTVLVLERVTVAPPAGAAVLKTRFTVADAPPFTVEGLTVTASSMSGTDNFVTKESIEPPMEVRRDPAVTGKSWESVNPAT